MINLKNNQTFKLYTEKNWNDTTLNIITRKNNKVYIEIIYRYAPVKKITMSYADYKKWRKEFASLGTLIEYYSSIHSV